MLVAGWAFGPASSTGRPSTRCVGKGDPVSGRVESSENAEGEGGVAKRGMVPAEIVLTEGMLVGVESSVEVEGYMVVVSDVLELIGRSL